MKKTKEEKKVLKPSKIPLMWDTPVTDIQKHLISWYQKWGRHHLPWLASSTSDYGITVSEIMMQQTTVSTGLQRFPLWMKTFPTWQNLAEASEDSVMKAWEGLGYYNRARSLHKTAKLIVQNYQNKIPKEREKRLSLPGIGPSTASALGSFIYGYREPIWDANVQRIWKRWWGRKTTAFLFPQTKESREWFWSMALDVMPISSDLKDQIDPNVQLWNQILMDFGSQICTPKKPNCLQCPLLSSCFYAQHPHDSLYTISPKSSTKESVWKNWALIELNQKIAIQKPQKKGIWAGLWTLPECLVYPLNELKKIKPLSFSGKHILSHRQVFWTITQMLPSFYQETFDTETSSCLWVTYEELDQLALPKPLRVWWDNYKKLILKNK